MLYVKDDWATYPIVGGMHGLYSKLSQLKHDLQRLNKNIFVNIFFLLEQAEGSILHSERLFDEDPSSANRQEYHRSKAKYLSAAQYEFSYWKQKARIRWLNDGDTNTKFYPLVVKGRRCRLRIQHVQTSMDVLCDTQATIQDEAFSFYTELFAKADIGYYQHRILSTHYATHPTASDTGGYQFFNAATIKVRSKAVSMAA